MPVVAQDQSSIEPGASRKPRVLVVDDKESIRFSLGAVLEHNLFDVMTAGNVNEALKLIGLHTFDVLLSDLHMPDAGDGLTVVSAMRHANPKAITMIFTAYPAMKEAAAAILRQTDEILVKPLHPETLVKSIQKRLLQEAKPDRVVKSVADILEMERESTIEDWLARVALEPVIQTIPMDPQERSAYLPALFNDLIARLRHPLPLGSHALSSPTAMKHGLLRRKQGYTAAMMVEESRMLQVSIFQTLHNNLHKVDFSVLLVSVMAIADGVDSQLAQAMASYVTESKIDNLVVNA